MTDIQGLFAVVQVQSHLPLLGDFCRIDQQKASWLKSDFCGSCASYTVDNRHWNFLFAHKIWGRNFAVTAAYRDGTSKSEWFWTLYICRHLVW